MQRSYNIDSLHSDIMKGKPVVLFVGTGIHYAPGLLDLSWNKTLNYLLRKALAYMCGENNIPPNVLDTIMSTLSLHSKDADPDNPDWVNLYEERNARMSPMVMASIIKHIFKGNYLSELQYFLYKDEPAEIIRRTFERYYALEKGKTTVGEVPQLFTLYQLARFILLYPVKAIVSYNYDNLLTEATDILYKDRSKYFTEEELQVLEQRPFNKHRERIILVEIHNNIDSNESHKDIIPVYHPHGYVPPPYKVMREGSEGIVLSMEEYYDSTKDVFSWQTATQEHLLCHYTCILAGLSLNDITIQRMLRYAGHYGNADKIYYMGALSHRNIRDMKYETAYRALMGILASFYTSYGLVLVSSDSYHTLYNDFGKIINEYCIKFNDYGTE